MGCMSQAVFWPTLEGAEWGWMTCVACKKATVRLVIYH